MLGAVVLALALLGAATPAHAALHTLTLRYGPIAVGGYSVRYGTTPVPAPEVDGSIVWMHARLVDASARAIPLHAMMLHHVVFLNTARRDSTYCRGSVGQRFFGTGEDDEILDLPAGYGYPVASSDRWIASWMLMNHQLDASEAYLQYTVVVDDAPRTPVVPYWIGAVRCSPDPVWTVSGGGLPGQTRTTARDWTVPRSGRAVFATAHLHGGATALKLQQPSCGDRTLVAARPWYGLRDNPVYHVLPVLHEPGPIAATTWSTPTGIPLRRGDRLSLRAVYDATHLHARVMGILHLYVAPPDFSGPDARDCPPVPGDARTTLPPWPGTWTAPVFPVPLTGLDSDGRAHAIAAPPGPLVRVEGRSVDVDVGGDAFSRRNLSVPRGTRVTWRFTTRERHDVTVADGPRGFASSQRLRPSLYRHTLDRPGTYRLMCTLHPVAMTERIVVR